jgi:ABC-type multidrug transport system ATPase subunit
MQITIASHGIAPLAFNLPRLTVVVGPNGSGKSALLFEIFRQVRQHRSAQYVPGHRQIITSNEHLEFIQQPVDQFELQLYQHHSHYSRFRSAWPEDAYKVGFKRFTDRMNYENFALAKAYREGKIEDFGNLGVNVLGTLNKILSSGGLPISIEPTALGLRARRGDSLYTIDRMSDGERAVVSLLASIVSRPAGDVLCIDEPERHLHPSISAPLWKAAVEARKDLCFVFCTHDLALVDRIDPEICVHIRDSRIVTLEPEQRTYDVHIIGRGEIGDDLRSSIVGARRKILFVEGEKEDRSIYQIVFPDQHVVVAGGWQKVVENVRAIRGNASLTWLECQGIIDRDGKTPAQVTAYEAEGIWTLPCPSIENLIYCEPVVALMAQVASTLGPPDADARLEAAKAAIRNEMETRRDSIIQKIVAWKTNDLLSTLKVSSRDIANGLTRIPEVNVEEIKMAVAEEVDVVIGQDPFEAVARLPIKDTGVPSAIAKAVGYPSKSTYYSSLLHQVATETQQGKAIEAAFKFLVAR